jgi:hypothetical protein
MVTTEILILVMLIVLTWKIKKRMCTS